MTIGEKHEDKIMGALYCYDRINIKCTAGMLGFAMGMAMFFNTISRKCFEFHKVFEPITKEIIENAEKIAKDNNI